MPKEWFWLEWQLKGAALLALVWGAHWLLRRRSAACRAWVWTLAWGGLLVLPLVATWGPKWGGLSLQRGAPNAVSQETHAVLEVWGQDIPEGYVPAPSVDSAGRRVVEPLPIRWGRLGALLWCGGLILLGIRTARDGWRAHQLVTRSRPADTGLVGVMPNERVRFCAGTGSPFSLWWGHFWICLPETARSWDRKTLAAALAHERAHIRRGDPLVLWVARLAVGLHWMNPLAWRGLGLWRRSQEIACDDAVLQSGADAQTYAEALLTVARHIGGRSSTPRLGVGMAGKGDLSNRLKAILDGEGSTRPLSRRVAVWIGAFGCVATLTVGGVGPQVEKAPKDGELQFPLTSEGLAPTKISQDGVQLSSSTSKLYSLKNVIEVGMFRDSDVEKLKNGTFNQDPGIVGQLIRLGLKVTDSFELDIEKQTLFVRGDEATHSRIQEAIAGLLNSESAERATRTYRLGPKAFEGVVVGGSLDAQPVLDTDRVTRTFRADPRAFHWVKEENDALFEQWKQWRQEVGLTPGDTVFYNPAAGVLLVRAPEAALERVVTKLKSFEPEPPSLFLDVGCSVVSAPMSELSDATLRDVFRLLHGSEQNARFRDQDRRVGRLTRNRLSALQAMVSQEPFVLEARPQVRTLVGRQAELQVGDIRVMVMADLLTTELDILSSFFAVDLDGASIEPTEGGPENTAPYADWNQPLASANLFSGQAWWFTMIREGTLWVTVLEPILVDASNNERVISPRAIDQLPQNPE